MKMVFKEKFTDKHDNSIADIMLEDNNTGGVVNVGEVTIVPFSNTFETLKNLCGNLDIDFLYQESDIT